MATINNSDLTKELIDGAKINTSVDAVPGALAEKVVPVMEVNPKLLRVCNVVRHNTAQNTTATIYSTPSNKDFYLVSINLNHSDEEIGLVDISAVIDGETQVLARGRATTQQGSGLSININLSIPLKIDRDTNITITSGALTLRTFGTIFGFIVEN